VNANPDEACPHEHFEADVTIERVLANEGDAMPAYFMAEITAACADCGESFRWTGLQAGMSPRKPMCSPDETKMRAPLRPASADPDFGMSLPGFAVTWRENP
jgi:hypothetical protein